MTDTITAPTADLDQLVANHDVRLDQLTLNEEGKLDDDAARVTEELGDFGIDLGDPTVARTVLALTSVIEARVIGDIAESGQAHPWEQDETALDAISDVLVGAAESAARQAA